MKILLMISLLVLLAGIAVPQTSNESEVTVGIGCETTLAESGLSIKFVEVLEDSRCPEGANCIWAGIAKIRVEIGGDDAAAAEKELVTNGDGATVKFNGYTITLKSLTPHPKTGESTEKCEYKATFVISKKT